MSAAARLTILVLLGLVAYLGFLVASLPAAQAWRWAGDQVPAQAYGLSGTVWEGQAAVVLQDGRRLDAVQWKLAPAKLLLGRLAANVQARLPDGRLRSEVTVAPGGRLTARQLRLDMPAPALLQWLGLTRLPVQVDGRLDALLRELSLEGQRLLSADGLLSWHGAVIRFGNAPLPLGEVALRLEPATGGINGTLSNQGAPIDLGGTLRLTPDGRFVLDMAVQAQGEVGEDTRRAMVLLGIPVDGSQVRARLSGALDGSGLRLEPLR